jgi:hypothetical protein
MKQTDNSYLEGKVNLRLESLAHINKKEVKVLEAFGGDGVIWELVKQRSDKQIAILRIDKKQDKRGVYLKGDNIKFLKSISLEPFDIVDLDAYGSPFNQLEIVFRRRYKGIVHCTYIQTGMGQINKKLLERLGYTSRMIDKCPTLFSRQPFQKMLNYLSIHNVKEISVVQATERKNYFYFFLK